MALELRKSGIDVVGDIPWGTHYCHFSKTKEDLCTYPLAKSGGAEILNVAQTHQFAIARRQAVIRNTGDAGTCSPHRR